MTPGHLWIDVQLVAMGYLRSHDGRWRHIPGLDVIARDTRRLGVRVRWGIPHDGVPACAYLDRREIVLQPVLFEYDEGAVLKTLWSHELAHIAANTLSEERAEAWQLRRYEGLLLPVWAA